MIKGEIHKTGNGKSIMKFSGLKEPNHSLSSFKQGMATQSQLTLPLL